MQDPERRAYLAALRKVQDKVHREHEDELKRAGFFGRIALRFRMDREIRRLSREIRPPARREAEA